MHKLKGKFGNLILVIASMLISMFAAIVVPMSWQSSSTNAIVIGTKTIVLRSESGYLFKSNTNLIFEATQKTGWTFDHIEIDFGCEVGGVTGSNVTKIFTVDGGYIISCLQG